MFEKNQGILLHPKGETTMPTRIKALVCDDDAAFCQKIADLVRRNQPEDGSNVAVTICCDPAALTDKDLGKFDIAFLDIDMGAYSGLELARHIRGLNLDTILIFVTNYVQYSLEGYEVQAFRYLLKSELEEKLPGYYQKALEELQHSADEMTFNANGEQLRIKYQDILYMESRQRVMRLFTLTDTRSRGYFYASMEDTEKQLAPVGFLRVQRSYLVNMAHIQKLNYDRVILTDGTELPVSQKMYSSIKAKYLRWRNRQ